MTGASVTAVAAGTRFVDLAGTRFLDLDGQWLAYRKALRAATYIEFLLGHGEAPGVDLGNPLQFDREGRVYSQRFTRGLTLANVGDEPCEVTLDRPYYDLAGYLRTSVVLPAGSADVLRIDAAGATGVPGPGLGNTANPHTKRRAGRPRSVSVAL